MLDKPIEQITLADLQELVDDRVQEGKTIEYKREMYRLDIADSKGREKQREELLKDISSFANTTGGHLLIGVDEDNGVPTDVCGFECANPDAIKSQITQLIEKWLEPRISLTVLAIQNESDRCVLVIRIPQSRIAPHRVVYKNAQGQFWARNSTGAYRMEYVTTSAILYALGNNRRQDQAVQNGSDTGSHGW